MKRNNYLTYLKKIIVTGSEKQQLILLLCIALINVLAVLIVFRTNWVMDTDTYFSAGENFINGEIDKFRTPVYSLICAAATRITSHYTILLIGLQILAYFISIPFLYKICRIMIRSLPLALISTGLYAALPCFSIWIYALITETFALSGIIILSYCYIHFLKYYDKKSIWSTSIIYTLLLLLRPAFIFILPIFIFFLIYWNFLRKKNYIIYTLSLIIPIITYVAYCNEYKNTHGVFTTSIIGNVNQYEILRLAKILDLDMINSSLKDQYITKSNDGTVIVDTLSIRLRSTPLQMHQVVTENLSRYKKEYVVNAIYKFIHLGTKPCLEVYANNRIIPIAGFTIRMTKALSPTFAMLYVILIFYLFVIIHQWKKNSFPILTTYIWLIVSGMTFTTIVGAQGDYTRLLLPVTPLILPLLFMIIDKLNIQSFQSILKGYY